MGMKSIVCGLLLLFCRAACAQQAPEAFHWADFHAARDQSIVTWVQRTLDPEKWSAIREIGVEYDAALVVTTLRTSGQTAANADQFTVWTVSLSQHRVAALLTGWNLRWLDFMRFQDGAAMEPAFLYDSCTNCAADTYFTAMHYDLGSHDWTPRWMRGNQTAPVWTGTPPPGVEFAQAFAGFSEGNGVQFVATWNRFGKPGQKKPEDYLFRYDLDPITGWERTLALTGAQAEAMRQRICAAQGAIQGLAKGQDGPLCATLQAAHVRPERRPATTPPAKNEGQSKPR